MAASGSNSISRETHSPPAARSLDFDESKFSVSEGSAFGAYEAGGRDTPLSERTLAAYKRALKDARDASMTPPAHGSSGFTFMCESPASNLYEGEDFEKYGLDREEIIEFVLKWVVHRDAANETVCTELCAAFGLDAPTIKPLDGKTAQLFVSPTKKAKAAFTPDPFQLLIMNRMEGSNLFQMCKDRTIFDISGESWRALLETLGQAAMFDLFIGNFDRVLRFDRGETGYALKEKGYANLGNVVLEVTPERGRTISRVSMIDTTSVVGVNEDVEAMEKLAQEVSLAGFFDEAGYETPEEGSSAPIKSKEPVYPLMHEFFVAMAGATEAGDDIIARHVLSSVENGLCNVLDDELDLDQTDADVQALVEKIRDGAGDLRVGILKGLSRLRDPTFCASANAIAPAGSTELQELV